MLGRPSRFDSNVGAHVGQPCLLYHWFGRTTAICIPAARVDYHGVARKGTFPVQVPI